LSLLFVFGYPCSSRLSRLVRIVIHVYAASSLALAQYLSRTHLHRPPPSTRFLSSRLLARFASLICTRYPTPTTYNRRVLRSLWSLVDITHPMPHHPNTSPAPNSLARSACLISPDRCPTPTPVIYTTSTSTLLKSNRIVTETYLYYLLFTQPNSSFFSLWPFLTVRRRHSSHQLTTPHHTTPPCVPSGIGSSSYLS